jgi:phage baseplate assembly protein W
MATIYLDNLIKPREVNSSSPYSREPSTYPKPTYTDLHLDLKESFHIGNGTNISSSNDIEVDLDIHAIRNAIRNIFTTRPGGKILNPSFGSRLDVYLFDQISDFKANLLGNDILKNLTTWEPRINVTQVVVTPNPDENTYYVQLKYKILDSGLIDDLQIQLNSNPDNNSAMSFSYTSKIQYV